MTLGRIIRVHAAGPTPESLFEDAAHQLFRSLTHPDEVGSVLREKISLEAPALPELLQFWLTELLRLTREENMLLRTAKVLQLGAIGEVWQLQAELTGELMDPHRHTIHIDLTNRFSILVEMSSAIPGAALLKAHLQITP